VHIVSDVRQVEVYTAEPLVPGPSRLEVEIAIAKLKSIHLQVVMKFRQNRLKQEAMPSTSYKMLSNRLLSSLSPYIDEIFGDYRCWF
jgi:hypothetical protein